MQPKILDAKYCYKTGVGAQLLAPLQIILRLEGSSQNHSKSIKLSKYLFLHQISLQSLAQKAGSVAVLYVS